jgi:transcriptional regulator NrdR family protein
MLKCPNCGSDESRVTETKATPDGTAIARYRACKNCGNNFRTHEVLAVYAGRKRGIVLDLEGNVE